ncbi:FAD/NAD(P)-binding domain-containing protein [Aureobasidium subglaciale]|nr:FAD/NAD(P)-binding domain-containing protein [Aureobasidium subglaciale]
MPLLEGKLPRIIIAGAGIGGLTTALSLHAAGFTDIHIFEAASNLTTLGVGINVQPSAVLILRNLGLLPALKSTAIETKELNFYNRHGDAILSEPRGESAGYMVPQFSIHRGEFQILLLDAVKERLGADRVHLSHALASFEQDEELGGHSPSGTITARFVRKSDLALQPEIPEMTGEVLIAADGINSVARKLLYPEEGPPRFSGRMLWRGCHEQEPYLTGASMVWAGHADEKFIAYPISGNSMRNEKSLVNWIAELRIRDEDDPDLTPPPVDWTKMVPKSKFEGPFQKWTCGGLSMKQLIDDTDKVYEFPMCDRDPVPRWSVGRVTLLGDSAHPMYPIGSNGASQSVIDAEAITQCLLNNPRNVVLALEQYQAIRLPPTAKIVMANRAGGPDYVLQLAHERAPDGFKNIYDVVPKEELEGVGKQYKLIAGFEMESVNKKAQETEGTAEKAGLKSPVKWTNKSG